MKKRHLDFILGRNSRANRLCEMRLFFALVWLYNSFITFFSANKTGKARIKLVGVQKISLITKNHQSNRILSKLQLHLLVSTNYSTCQKQFLVIHYSNYCLYISQKS